MAGYSATPLPRKLGIKPGSRLALLNAPDGLAGHLAPMPAGVQLCGPGEKGLDVALLFCTTAAELTARFSATAARLQPAGGLWVAWPKKAAGVATDLDGNRVRAVGLAAGLVDNKVCAVTDVWSGLRFVYRRKDRPGGGKG